MARVIFTGQTVSRRGALSKPDFGIRRLFFGLLFPLVELLEILRRVFLEILQAGLATELDLSALVLEDVGFAH
jgi:hypothetical protein